MSGWKANNRIHVYVQMIVSYPPPAPGGPLINAVNRISTEYRLQFAWPRAGGGRRIQDVKTASAAGLPRKSLSMGAIRPVPVHKKRGGDFEKGGEGQSILEANKWKIWPVIWFVVVCANEPFHNQMLNMMYKPWFIHQYKRTEVSELGS
jgi:hypothetical protein